MMDRKAIKGAAKSQIKGNWPTYFLVVFVWVLISGLVQGFFPYIPVAIVIQPLMAYGCATMSHSIYAGRRATFDEGFSKTFKKFGTAFVTGFMQMLYLLLWALIPVAGIVIAAIKSYSYSLSMYITEDKNAISGSEAVTRSRELMDGNKWRMFVQDLSFIGWILLGILTIGILYIWLVPYMAQARYNLYQEIVKEKKVRVI